MNWNKITIKSLYSDYIDAQPVDVSEIAEGYSDDEEARERIIYPAISEKEARAWLESYHGRKLGADEIADLESEGVSYVHEIMQDNCDFERSMYHAYAVDGDADEMQLQIYRADCGSTTITEIDGQPYLGLSGGGEDLSWDFAAAFIAIGQLPPADIRLPRFAGMRATPKVRKIISALERANQIRILRARFNVDDCRRLRKDLASK